MTVVGSRRRVDATLPAAIPIADLLWDLVEMLGESTDGAPARWALVRVGGQALDPELGLQHQGVIEGTMLFLRDITSPLPAPVVDDYVDRVAIAVDAQGGRWTKVGAQILLVGAAAVCLLAAGMLVLLTGDRGFQTVAGLAGAAVATMAGVVMAQILGRRLYAGLIVLAALPLWASAGTGLAGEAGADFIGILAAALGMLTVGAWIATLVGDDLILAPAIGLIAATLLPALVLGACFAAGVGLLAAAAVLAPLGLAGLALAPALATRIARLDDPDPASLAARARSGRRLLAGLLIGIAAMLTGAIAILAASGGWFASGLVAATVVGVIAKARHFRFAAEVAPLVAAGLAGVILLELSLVLQLAPTSRAAGTVAVLIADTLLLVAASAAVRRLVISPGLRRQLGRLDLLATVASVPLALGVLGVYQSAARFAHGLI